jgi:hypothetical protein
MTTFKNTISVLSLLALLITSTIFLSPITCQIPTSFGCLDDSEITEYNITNNDNSICKIEIFGICTDGMSKNEVNELAIYYTENNN